MIDARFGHVSIVARDWRALAGFYERVLGCRPVPPERDLRGPVLEAGTGVPGAALRGVHLRLPGLGGPDGATSAGPTLEIYQYERPVGVQPAVANRVGLAHLAFAVLDVAAGRELFLAEGGSAVGSVVTTATADGRHVTWTYVRDPEGNIVELQAWSEPGG